jgi:hypothetical protein
MSTRFNPSGSKKVLRGREENLSVVGLEHIDACSKAAQGSSAKAMNIQDVAKALGQAQRVGRPAQVKVAAQPIGTASVLISRFPEPDARISVEKVKWGGIGWDCAWSPSEATLYVCADVAIIKTHATALGVLAGLAAVHGGLGPVKAKAGDLYDAHVGRPSQESQEMAFDRPRTTKDAARQIVTNAVKSAIGMGLTMQEVRLAVLSAFGLDSE